jgi:hypothetical protein
MERGRSPVHEEIAAGKTEVSDQILLLPAPHPEVTLVTDPEMAPMVTMKKVGPWIHTRLNVAMTSSIRQLRGSQAVVVQEKVDLEKTKRKKAQRFQNLLCKKLAELRRNTEELVATLGGWCEDFPATDATVSNQLDWFQKEVQALPTTFVECNKNITCFMLVGVFKMLAVDECEHLSKLKKLALSCDASILHDVSDDIGRIVEKLIRNLWTNHGLSYCMQKIEEENRRSFTTMCFDERRCIVV